MTLTDAEKERLSAWLDGETTVDAARDVETWIAENSEVENHVSDYRDIDAAVRRARREDLSAPTSAAVLQTIEDEFARRRRRVRGAAFVRAAIPIAASLVILMGGGFWLDNRMTERFAFAQSQTGQLVAAATQRALEAAQSGESVRVGNDGTIVSGTITPVRTYRSKTSHWCREFRERLIFNGDRVERSSIACRENDGVWRRVETTVKGEAPLMIGSPSKI